MALKSTYAAEEKGAEIEESLDDLDALIDRVKVLYEQYFMGIQRQPPTHLHTDVERRLRDLTQLQIRNTALRYRFLTLQQKHGAYNTYWKRTLREIESGSYLRNLSRLRAKVAKTGDAVPEEILAKMPKRMRDAIARDRELALAKAQREGRMPIAPTEAAAPAVAADGLGRRAHRDTGSEPAVVVNAAPRLDDVEEDTSRLAAPAGASPAARQPAAAASRPGRDDRHLLDDILGDDDIDAALSALADEAAVQIERRQARASEAPPTPAGRTQPMAFTASKPPAPATASKPPAPATASKPPVPATAKVVPPIKVVPPTFSRVTPPVGVPLRAATPPVGVPLRAATPPVGVPLRAATPPVGVPVGLPAIPPVRSEVSRPVPTAPPSGIPGMSEADTRALYAKYVKARTLVGDATEPMTYERLVKTLSSQAPKILREHHSTGVEFNVVVKDNKVVLKAKPK